MVASIRASGAVTADVKAKLTTADSSIKISRILIGNALDADPAGTRPRGPAEGLAASEFGAGEAHQSTPRSRVAAPAAAPELKAISESIAGIRRPAGRPEGD